MFAGLWRRMLPGALLWRIEERCTRPEEYCGPTWSWCSVVGPVVYPAYQDKPFARGLLITGSVMKCDLEPLR